MTFNSMTAIGNRDLFEGFCRELDAHGIGYETITDLLASSVGWTT